MVNLCFFNLVEILKVISQLIFLTVKGEELKNGFAVQDVAGTN